MKLAPFLALLLAAAPAQAAPTTSPPPTCQLTPADKLANAKLPWLDFDQVGTTPTTARALGNRDCDVAAAEAGEHYMVFGPKRSEREQRILAFHLAQSMAIAGKDERGAARLAAAARDPEPRTEPDSIDWNHYVAATWAFLVKDRAAFDMAAAALARSTNVGDKGNSAILTGLGRCFTKSYAVAYNPDCGK